MFKKEKSVSNENNFKDCNMRIAFVFDGLGVGGVERVGVDYVNICLRLGYSVDVYNLSPKDDALASHLPESVGYFQKKMSRNRCPEVYSYGVQKCWWGKYAYALVSPIASAAQGVRKFFTKKRKYDVAVAFSGHVNDLSFVAKGFVRADMKICWCHGTILSYFAMCDAYAMLYKKIDKFVVLSSVGQNNIYAGHRFMYEKEIRKIYNPTFVKDRQIDERRVDELKKKYGDFILTVGRFARGKAQDVAILTVKELKERGMSKHIVFLGDGERLETVREFASEQGVEDLCHFEGSRLNVVDYISASYVNLLTSRWEGLPTVIVEAMAFGKPCVMTNSDDGEVSAGGKFCKVVPIDDVNGLADALAELYGDEVEYRKYSELAKVRSEDFTVENVGEQFVKLLER